MKEDAINFIKQVAIDLVAAILTSSVVFSGGSRLFTGYWMRWVRTPYIYIWAGLVILVLVWIRKRYQNKKKNISNS